MMIKVTGVRTFILDPDSIKHCEDNQVMKKSAF